jgi:hypothetical protein
MFGKAIFSGADKTVLTVSNNSLIRKGQLVGVFIIDEDSRARFRLVKLGKGLGDRTEVLAGVKEGEKVIVSPSHEVTDGRLIRSSSARIRNSIEISSSVGALS